MGKRADSNSLYSKEYKKAEEKIFINNEIVDVKKNKLFNFQLFQCLSFWAGFGGVFTGGFFLHIFEMEMSDISAVIAVLTAGVVSLMVANQSKENEIDKHREKWCADLREHYSNFSAAVNAFSRKLFEGCDRGSLTH